MTRATFCGVYGMIFGMCASTGTLLAQPAQLGPIASSERSILREGEGSRRALLDARERMPFDPTTWAKLSDWKNGAGLTATDTKDKVVLVCTWTDYLPACKRAVQAAQRVAARHASDGVIVVLVHSSDFWDKASKPMPTGGTLLVAHDSKGEFRKALDVDHDPDFYVIDRAGQLRYADIMPDSVDAAVAHLVKETPENATSIVQRLDDERMGIDREFRRTSANNQNAKFVDIPEQSFAMPSEEDYAKVNWPKRPADESKLDRDPNAQLPTKVIELPKTGWYPKQPELKGRAVMLYVWSPHIGFSYYDVMPEVDRMQRQFGRDVVVVGVMCDFSTMNSYKLTDDQRNHEKLMQRFDDICKTRKFEHSLVPSLDVNPYLVINENVTEVPAPGLMILSSDGTCRWWQHEKSQINPLAALAKIIELDPGIQARKRAEEEWLKTHKGGN
jgi:thiol-disulfide isomerase/thioredoxin